MFTRAELEYKSRACTAQLKLRVIFFSMLIALPLWLIITLLKKLGYDLNPGLPERAIGSILLLIYAAGVLLIYRRTQHDHEMLCPNCKRLLGPELRNVTKDGACKSCRAKIVKG
jgi:hypothetical protein